MDFDETMKQKYVEYLENTIVSETYELSEEDFYYALVTDQGQSQGSFLGNEYEVSEFDEHGIATVYDRNRRLYNHIDITGQVVDEWRDHRSEFQPIRYQDASFLDANDRPVSDLNFKYVEAYSDGMYGVGHQALKTMNLVTPAGHLIFGEDFYDSFHAELEYLLYSPLTKTVALQFEDEEIKVFDLLGNQLNSLVIEGSFVHTNSTFLTKPGLYLMKQSMPYGSFGAEEYKIVSEDGADLMHSKNHAEMEAVYRNLNGEVRDGCYVYRFKNGVVCDWIPQNHAVSMKKSYYAYNFRDRNGNKLLDENFRMGNDSVFFTDCVQYFSGVQKPDVALRFSSYKLKTPEKTYRLDYQPLRDYGSYVLCMNQNQLLLYDKAVQDYQLITNDLKPKDVLFIDQNKFSFLGKMYFVQANQMVDISCLKLTDYTKITSADPLEPILDYNTFVQKYQRNPQIIEQMRQEKIKKEQELLREEHKQKELRRQQMIEENNAKIGELLESAVRLVQLNNRLDSDMVTVRKHIPDEVLFVEKEDHREFNPMFLMEGFLRYVDFSSVSFDQTKVSGINFKGTNASIDPQTVYQKDMSNGIYDGLNFNLKSFDGVNTKNSSFENCIMDFVGQDVLENVGRKR